MKQRSDLSYSPRMSRRDLLRWGAAATAAAALGHWSAPELPAAVSSTWLTIEKIDRTTIKLPFREVPGRAMAREIPHWQYTEICEVTLKSGKTGFGETLLFYTWGVTTDEAVQRCRGKNAAELMWDDSLGAGLQLALFDAVARTLELPIHALLGKKQYARTPLSWWNIDLPPEDLASECALAYKSGYLSLKSKGRPWFDLWKQLELSVKVVPESFKIDMDFNDTLRTAEQAIPILREFDSIPQVDIWEGPLPQSDLEGNHRSRRRSKPKWLCTMETRSLGHAESGCLRRFRGWGRGHHADADCRRLCHVAKAVLAANWSDRQSLRRTRCNSVACWNGLNGQR